jgi:hypothetical protein
MRTRRFDPIRAFGDARRGWAVVALAGLSALAFSAAPALSAPTRAGSSPPSITPGTGRPFVPATGDWEGTVSGFPASFDVRYDARNPRAPGYAFDKVLALVPAGCPVNPARYAEDVISAARPSPIQASGSFGLARLGFDGRLQGPASAVLSTRYRSGSCSGRLTWHMRPARRASVPDGRWRATFGDGERAVFGVRSGGRLATAIALPAALARCGGPAGGVDLFIGPSGQATLNRPDLRISIQFSGPRAYGRIDGGRRCPGGSLRVAAQLQK